ncbi:CPBP family glutamic-type intramembrane protease [Pigmentiphaga soli]|uniref:CPBP family glutamic-type intramembrane protease n=2 Tax=Pigmentiphaga soli TaxID=1007095 RepID=A0ABP8HHG1_9BURK
MSGVRAECVAGLVPGRLLRWLAVLWFINLALLGPLSAGVATLTGSENRLLELSLPWPRVVLWAPLIEEMLLRFGLRRPAQAVWLVPLLLIGLLAVETLAGGLLLAAAAACVLAMLARLRYGWSRAWLRRYRRAFPVVFHAVTLLFAVLHLGNFRLGGADAWLLPLLVLPQWGTGLVLGWLRVRTGIGASVALHALFNAGPMALLWLVQQYGLDA